MVLLSFLWGSTVLGIAFRSAEMEVSAWWLVLLVGSVPIVVLLIVTSRMLRRRSPETRSAGQSAGHQPASGADPPSPVQPQVGGDITDREREVLALLSTGRTHSEIAKELFVAPGTVKAHVNSIYRKLGARNRTEALHRARETGLLE